DYHHWTKEQVRVAKKLNQVEGTLEQIDHWAPDEQNGFENKLGAMQDHWLSKLDSRSRNILDHWDELYEEYQQDNVEVQVRDKTFKNEMFRESLSGLQIPRIALPKTDNKGEQLKFGVRSVIDRKSTRLNSCHVSISYAVFCLKKKIKLVDKR